MSILKANALLDTSGDVLSRVLQVKYSHSTIAGNLSNGDTITQLTTNITPSATSSSILVIVNFGFVGADSAADVGFDILRDSTALQQGSGGSGSPANVTSGCFTSQGGSTGNSATAIIVDDEISTTSQVAYSVVARPNSGRQFTINRRGNDNALHSQSRMILFELPKVN
tara:strand:- start:245 stop:751 length:507 start_codon:yes stop_codon:yes gene_type:complete